jgi:hypothetical protein
VLVSASLSLHKREELQPEQGAGFQKIAAGKVNNVQDVQKMLDSFI